MIEPLLPCDPLGLVHPSWLPALEPQRAKLDQVWHSLATDLAAGHEILPAPRQILRAFEQSFDQVRVLIIGQDPYPTPGHAMGLAFATAAHVRPLPASLRNIAQELESDVGATLRTGDLSHWECQGVLLLNRCLSVRAGVPGSHHGRGWEEITSAAVTALGRRHSPLVAVLWGRQAQQLSAALGSHPVLKAPHPSPLSAHRGFFGSRPFSQINAALEERGAKPIAW
ncbi:MAG TPA: uracil-DNA glycosylase [Actinomycetales bacterium]|nr:uracil-DNA glycosylase [Actinomycetales bacterium]